MTARAWIVTLLFGLLPCWSMPAAAAEAPPAHEGTVQGRTATHLKLKRLDGRSEQVALADIVKPFDVAPGTLIQLHKKASAADAAAADKAAAGTPTLQSSVVGGTLVGTVQEIAADQSWLILRSLPATPPKDGSWDADKLFTDALARNDDNEAVYVSLQVDDDLRTLVATMRAGDGVKAVYRLDGKDTQASNHNVLKRIEWRKARVGAGWRWVALAGAALLLLAVATLFTRGKPWQLYLGEDNRYSSSKFQTVLWFWVVVSTYLAFVLQRLVHAGMGYLGGVDIPANLLLLSGMSVLGAAGAKLITTTKEAAKVDPAKTTDAGTAKQMPKQDAAQPAAADLVNDDFDRVDLGDFQMITVTGIAVVMYAVAAVEFMSVVELRSFVKMPDVDSTLLALFGLSQAGYLGKKAAGDSKMTPEQAITRAKKLADEVKAEAKKAKDAATPAADAATARKAAQTKLAELKQLQKTWANDAQTAKAIQAELDAAEQALA